MSLSPDQARPVHAGLEEPIAPHVTLRWPVPDQHRDDITQGWGENPEYYRKFRPGGVPLKGHNGIDFGLPEGRPIFAVADGWVAEARYLRDYGNYVKLIHPWGESLYAHLSQVQVRTSQQVKAAQTIGLSGNTGNSTGPHLHFSIRIHPYNRDDGWGGYSNPLPYLHRDGERIAPADVFDEAAKRYSLPANLLWAVTCVESSFRPDAVSPVGALGLMQLMPPTWDEWAPRVIGSAEPDWKNPVHNVLVGSRYLLWCQNTLETKGFKATWSWALAAYNWGIGNLMTHLEQERDFAALPAEVQGYADKVMSIWSAYDGKDSWQQQGRD